MESPAQRLARVGAVVFERGWLSSNNVLITGTTQAVLVDSGYATHAEQTLGLVQRALGPRTLNRLVNTHLHSDHCGGNALLQQRYPHIDTWIPPGQSTAVDTWDTVALSYQPTGQRCARFRYEQTLVPGSCLRLGDHDWEIHAAPGHDPHAILLFQPEHRILISADALWQRGFGVIFPELDGIHAFDQTAATLDLIETLAPGLVIPGHGPIFTDLGASLEAARRRLEHFRQAPASHLRHALKVLIKFHLLEKQEVTADELSQWAATTPYLQRHLPQSPQQIAAITLEDLLDELESAGALSNANGYIVNR